MTLSDTLAKSRRLMPSNRMTALLMHGLGIPKVDICATTGLDAKDVTTIRTGHHRLVKRMRANMGDTRKIMLQYQQDNAISRGLALSHSKDIAPRDLRQVASTAAILAKSIESTPSPTAEPVAPAAPARPSAVDSA